MRRMTARFSAALIVLAAGAAPVMADEVWSTPYGPMQWETTLGDMAVFNLYGDGVAPSALRLFLPGMALDAMGGRGEYYGFWTAESGERVCPAALTDPMGLTTRDWGSVELRFDRAEFPSGWTARVGVCFDAPGESIRGEAPAGAGK
ncbi:MAG: hypothetical protein JJU18_03135 [Oceanicaulis sp.]|nr:hypothetical protein [Oceanicaulis sp.]